MWVTRDVYGLPTYIVEREMHILTSVPARRHRRWPPQRRTDAL